MCGEDVHRVSGLFQMVDVDWAKLHREAEERRAALRQRLERNPLIAKVIVP